MTCPLDLDTTKNQLRIAQREIKTILHESVEKCKVANRTLSEIHVLTGITTAVKALKSTQNTEYMSKVWKR